MVSYIFQTIEFHFTCHSTGKYHSSLFVFFCHLAGTCHCQLVFLGELIHSQDGNNVLLEICDPSAPTLRSKSSSFPFRIIQGYYQGIEKILPTLFHASRVQLLDDEFIFFLFSLLWVAMDEPSPARTCSLVGFSACFVQCRSDLWNWLHSFGHSLLQIHG